MGPDPLAADVMPVLAHAGHWVVGLGYFSPVLFLIGFLLVAKLRERRD